MGEIAASLSRKIAKQSLNICRAFGNIQVLRRGAAR